MTSVIPALPSVIPAQNASVLYWGNMIRRFLSRLLGKPAPAASEPPATSPTDRISAPSFRRDKPEGVKSRPPRSRRPQEERQPTEAPAPNGDRPPRKRRRRGRGGSLPAQSSPEDGSVGKNGAGGVQRREQLDIVAGPAPRDMAFGPVMVSAPVSRALADMGYSAPTPIQELVIDPLLRGQDLVGQAQTGTGKTAGFGIPIAEAVDARAGYVQAIVLAPTRELARQVAEELSKICKYRGAEVVPVYGGARLGPQIKAIEDGAPVIVGTPGRVIDLIDRGVLRLDRTRMVVLDEADQMLDIGFLPAIRRILRATPRGRQTALFTATVPTMIKRLIYSYLNDPEWFRVGEESEPVEQVTQRYVEVARRDKLSALVELLDRNEQTLVFRRTQEDVDWLVRSLKRRDVRVEAIHGGLPQGERNTVMQDFRDGKLKLLVSTNLTSRGIDVPAVANVINYDIPETVEEYVHRIGRTARMGREGVAVTFVSEWDLDFFDAIKAHIGDDLAPMELSLYKTAEAVGA